MSNVAIHPRAFDTAPAVMRILSRFDRASLAGFISIAIDLLDLADGDADLEETGDDELTGDESDGNFSEDDAAPRFALIEHGPGCIIADNDFEHDGQEPRHDASMLHGPAGI